jgi:predicted enzyme related to lactoylglutathione lyase
VKSGEFIPIKDGARIIMIHLVVRDMDKAKAFYTGVLGFEATQDTTWAPGSRGVFVVPPGGGTYVGLVTVPGETRPQVVTMFLSSSDIEATYKDIQVKGEVPIMGIQPYPTGGRFFTINDPDGNFWHIIQT